MANPLIIGGRLTATGTGAVGIYCSGDTTIAHVDSITATTSISVVSYATASVVSNQFDLTATAGAGTIEYQYSDRSAWDVANYPARHASDIEGATFDYHNNPANPPLSAALTNGHIFVGNASNVAADVAMSGDVTIDNAGATTIGAKKVDASNIALADTKLLIGGADGAAHEQSMSADATIANSGALTLATVNANVGAFTNANITVNAKGLITAAASGSAGHTIQDEGISLTTRTNLNFVGSGVIVTDDAGNNASVVTIEAVYQVYNETQEATNGATYYLANVAMANTVRAYVNGIRQPVADTDTNSDEIIFDSAPAIGDTLLFDYELELA